MPEFYEFSPEMNRKSATERQNELSSVLGLQGLQGLYGILQSGGMTPQQRAMFSVAMNRNLGMQAEQAGAGLGRRFASQGIADSGLANAALGQIQSGLLSAQQQGEEGLNKQSLDLYLNALESSLGQNQFFRSLIGQERRAAKERKSRLLGQIFGTISQGAKAIAGAPGSGSEGDLEQD